MLQDLLQETDPADGLPVHPPRFTVSRIIAPVSLGAGLREVVRHLRINLVDQMLQLRGYLVVSLLRQVFHGSNLRIFQVKCNKLFFIFDF